MNMNLNKFRDKCKKEPKKFIANMVILLLCGVLLVLIGNITNSMSSKKKNNVTEKNSVQVATNATFPTSTSYEDRIKRDLTDTLSQISGVGKVSVMIYFECGGQSIPAMNLNDSNKKTEEKDDQGGNRVTTETTKSQNVVVVNESSGTKPFIVRQVNPRIGGVIIVAEGASNEVIREKINTSVQAVLNLPPTRVSVLPMKK